MPEVVDKIEARQADTRKMNLRVLLITGTIAAAIAMVAILM